MPERALTAQLTFKSRYPRTLEITLAVGIALHVLLFLTVPAIRIAPYRLREAPPIQVFEIPDEIKVQDPPKEVRRPEIPVDFEITPTADPTTTLPIQVDNPFAHPVTAGPAETPEFVSVDQEPAILKRVPPVYPDIAREAQAEGTVWVEIVVGTTGRVLDARVIRSDAIPALEKAALDAARQWLFTPGLQRHIPVKTRVRVPFVFSLR